MKKGILKGILIVVCLLVAVVLLNASGILNKDSKRINSKSNLDKEEKVTYKADKGYIIYNNKLYYPPFNIKVENDHMIINGEIKIYKKLGFDRELLKPKRSISEIEKARKIGRIKEVLIYLYVYEFVEEKDAEVKFKKIKAYFDLFSPIEITKKEDNMFIVFGEEILINSQQYKADWEGVYLYNLLDYIAELIRNETEVKEKERLKKHIIKILQAEKKSGLVKYYTVKENEVHANCKKASINLYFTKETLPKRSKPYGFIDAKELSEILGNSNIVFIKKSGSAFMKRYDKKSLGKIKQILKQDVKDAREKEEILRTYFSNER